MTAVQPIPEGYPRVCPVLVVDGAADAITFMSEVFDATERLRMPAPGGGVAHAEVAIGDSVVMLADANPEWGLQDPGAVGGSPVSLHVYVEDADAVFAKAIAAGAKELKPPTDHFYGDRSGEFEDPFGHRWSVSTHIEDVPNEEMARRAAEQFGV